jgi:hypothetical protein
MSKWLGDLSDYQRYAVIAAIATWFALPLIALLFLLFAS